MKILIFPWAKKLREKNTPHPKSYPFWSELVKLLKPDNTIIQVSLSGEELIEGVDEYKIDLKLPEMINLAKECNIFISIESFAPHFMHFNFKGEKRGIVLFSQSDPEIFGYPENINLLKDKKWIRNQQFAPWEWATFQKEAFPEPEIVCNAVMKLAKYYLEVS